jgi:hypothetical protein
MNRRFGHLDSGYLVVFLICILAIWPFISRSSLPQETDAELHIFRLAELSRLISPENPYPRWAPNFYYGFGYPIFNYYAPLSYYLGLIVASILSLGAVAGVKSVFILSLFAAGFGMYGYVRDNWGQSAGLIASASYLFAPYVLFIDPHARGDLAETLSLGLFPLALWALDRLRRRPTALNWAASIILTGSLIMSHNLMGLLFFGYLFAWSIWQQIFKQVQPFFISQAKSLTKIWSFRLFLALLLGVGVSAFFWLPLFLEREAVNLGTLVGQGGHFDFHNHFLTIRELLSPNKILDWGATEADFRFNLGLVQWMLAAIGVVLFALKKTSNSRTLAFFLITLLVFIVLMFPISAILWEQIPYMAFIQFPWRFLGPAAAALAIVSGAGFGALLSRSADRARNYLLAGGLGLILLSSLPLIQVTPWPSDFGPTTPLRILEVELSGRWLGTTATADFLPSSVEVDPRPEPSVKEAYYAGSEIDHVNRSTLPAGATVSSETITPTNQRFQTNSDEPFLLRLYIFDFPGWEARIDGKEVPIEIGRPEGFIVIPIPEGDHTVDLAFKSTSSRTISGIISLVSLLFTGFITWTVYKHSTPLAIESADTEVTGDSSSLSSLLPAIIVVAVIIIIQIIGGNLYSWFNVESGGEIAIPAESPAKVNYEGDIDLIGYTLQESNLSLGGTLDLTLYWKAQNPQEENYQVFIHVLDSGSNIIAQSDKLNPGDFPTERWPTNKYVRDQHQIELPENIPVDQYWIEVGLWTAADGNRLPVLGRNGEPIGDSYRLPEPVIVEDN